MLALRHIAPIALCLIGCNTAAQAENFSWDLLPKNVQAHAKLVRDSCQELNPDFKPYDPMQGITAVKLDQNGTRALIVDNENLCNGPMAGANCSNRGCDLTIWREDRPGRWSIIFKEHLHRSFISINEENQLKLMAVSIYAGDRKCQPPPGADFTSGQSCDALVTYQKGGWKWNVIR